MKRIPLTQGKYAIVDDDMYEFLIQWQWQCEKHGNGFRVTRTSSVSERCEGLQQHKSIFMHRLILGASKGMEVDHINHDGLDNRRANIRICTKSENQGNRRLQGGSSRFKGICWEKRRRRWKAYISKNKHTYFIGYFKDEIDAALAYDNKAKELHGNFACLNFPENNYV